MVKFCVFYYGRPEDPAAFDEYYWSHHLALVSRWPGIRRIELSKGQPGGELYQQTELYFDNSSDLETALQSAEREASYQDGLRLPKFAGEVKRQTFHVQEYRLR